MNKNIVANLAKFDFRKTPIVCLHHCETYDAGFMMAEKARITNTTEHEYLPVNYILHCE